MDGPVSSPQAPAREFTASAPSRLRNLILHELGHLQGLKHCRTPGCLMTPVMAIEELDYRQDLPCEICREASGVELLHRHYFPCPACMEAGGMEKVKLDSGPTPVALHAYRLGARS